MKRAKNIISAKAVQQFQLLNRAIVLACFILTGCNRSVSREPVKMIDTLTGNEWALSELRTAEGIITLYRPLLEIAGTGNAYTMGFEGKTRVHGTAASNYFIADCSWTAESAFTLGPVSLRKASVTRNLLLKEEDFFKYLRMINNWTITDDGQMILYSQGRGNNNWVTLIFERY
jgi:hypothetical protein